MCQSNLTLSLSITLYRFSSFKNDRRNGYGVARRSDGVRYEGEWLNNRKNGYGVTTLQNGTRVEGKYRNNEIVTSLSTSAATSGLFKSTNKVLDRVHFAVLEAERAESNALQKVEIAMSRLDMIGRLFY